MCGRFAYISSSERLNYQFQLSSAVEVAPRYNIAPGTDILCIVQTEAFERVSVLLRWGLIPSWVKEKKKMSALINARGDSVFEKPAFRHAIKSKRCIVPMSGFYEWKVEVGRKQPYYFRKKNSDLLAVAALWDTWQHQEEVIHSCCLITTEANQLMSPIHHRMPVLLDEAAQVAWLDNAPFNQTTLQSLIKPYSNTDLEGYAVTPLVNKAGFNHPVAIEPL